MSEANQDNAAAQQAAAANTAAYGAYLQGQAAQGNAAANLRMATPGMQQGNISNSMSGTYFLPWQEQLGQQYGQAAIGLLGKLGGKLDAQGNPLGGGSDFSGYWNSINGAIPQNNFTDIPTYVGMTPHMLMEQANSLFNQNLSGAGMAGSGGGDIYKNYNTRPGLASSEARTGHNADMFQLGTRAGLYNSYMKNIPEIMNNAQDRRLQSQVAQTGVENSRANQNFQLGNAALNMRGQDIEREGALWRTLGGLAGGGGGFGSPLQFSQSSSQSGPAGYLFKPSQYKPPKQQEGFSARVG